MSFAYDKRNRRSGITHPDGASQTFVYDLVGNLAKHTDALGVEVTREFDALNRETHRGFSSSADGLLAIDTAYDANGNVLTVTEKYAGVSRVTTKTYDAFDRPKTQSDGYGASMAFAYDLNGNRLELSTQDGKVTRYGYDGLNRLTGLTSPAGKLQYGYDKSSLLMQQTFGNGTVAKMAWDAAKRQKQVALVQGTKTLNLTEYTYDVNGNRLTERINRPHATSGAQVTKYGYDKADRLVSTELTRGSDTVVTTWTYDRSDNRLTEVVKRTGANAGAESRTYTYDDRSQLRSIDDSVAGATALDYDLQGNLVRKVRGSDTTVYGWNARDLLNSVSRNGTELGRYGSDYTGMRVTKEAVDPAKPNAGKQLRLTQWDAENALQDRDSGGAVVTRYDFAKRQAVAMWSQDDGSQWLHADALGSIVATTGNDGALKSETIYDAWGNPVEKAGFSVNKFAYTGHQADPETGLYYFKARYYDPEIGRFISEDPADGKELEPASYQRYLYAYANPLIYTDPSGMFSLSTYEKYSFLGPIPAALMALEGKDAVRAVGGLSGAALGVATMAVETAEVVGDASMATKGNFAAAQRTAHRIAAIGHAVSNPKATASAIAASFSNALTAAAAEEEEGNTFTAAILRGKLAAESVLAIEGGVGAVRSVGKLATYGVGRVSAAVRPSIAAAVDVAKARASKIGATESANATKEIAKENAKTAEAIASAEAKSSGTILDEAEAGPGVGNTGFSGARGTFSTREFDPSLAGGPLRDLSADRIKFTERGISVVEQHTARFGPDAANEYMIDRLRQISRGEIEATAVDRNFYSHELREFVRYRRLGWEAGQPGDTMAAYRLWNNAHTATLEEYRILGPITDTSLYHPNAIKLMEGN